MHKLGLVMMFLMLTCPVFAADHYIYSGATGSGNGSSCTNAYTGFGTGAHQINPASMLRGDTYWMLAGSYTNPTWSTPTSGTSVITIEGATAANHGSATDCTGLYGQAVFTGITQVTTSYWTFKGQAVSGCTYPSNSTSCYNLKWTNYGLSASCNDANLEFGGGAGHLNIEYVEMQGTTNQSCSSGNGDNSLSGVTNNLYVGYSYFHETGNTQFQMNGGVTNTATWEYNYVYRNHTSQNGDHDEAYSIYATDLIIRYNVFQDISGTGIITDAGGSYPSIGPWEIYGNLFFWDSSYQTLYPGKDGIIADLEVGVVVLLGETMNDHIYFYNNTIAGIQSSAMCAQGAGFSTQGISAGNNSGDSGTPVVIQENNLWYASAWTNGDGTNPYCSIASCSSFTQDYDAFYQGGLSTSCGQFTYQTETHGDPVAGSSSPFVNATAYTIAGYEPTTPDPFASHAGTSLSSPYNVDMLGTTRGSNGTWDRGALQIPGGGLLPPTALTAVVN